MKEEKFFGKGMSFIKEDYPDLYESIVNLNESTYTGKSLDYKTQKLIAVGIQASKSDYRATRKQMISAIEELDVSKDEIMDVLKIVLLTSGMPPFMKAVQILDDI